MPGHNHPPSCPCGWCVYDGNRISADEIISISTRSAANSLLKHNNAGTNLISCYVNPNAKCPVCSAAVFFYANSSGSRVYFNSLGHPWPKHECTDKQQFRNTILSTRNLSPPTRRPKGLIKELLQAAATVALHHEAADGRLEKDDWELGIVIEIAQAVNSTSIMFEMIKDTRQGVIRAVVDGRHDSITHGDFVGLKGNIISLFDKTTLIAKLFPVRFISRLNQNTAYNAAISEIMRIESETKQQKEVPRRSEILKDQRAAKLENEDALVIEKPRERHFIPTTAEMKHFQTSQKSIADTTAFYGPIIKSLARNGVRKPRDVSTRLRRLNHRTASGSEWTPRLTYLLLVLIFSSSNKNNITPKHRHQKQRSTGSVSSNSNRIEIPLNFKTFTAEEIERRLSLIGRVTRQK